MSANWLWILGERLKLVEGQYGNGRLAIQLETENGEPYTTLTVNLPNAPLLPGEFFVKTWDIESEEVVSAALKSGIFVDTGARVPTGYVQAEVWRYAEDRELQD